MKIAIIGCGKLGSALVKGLMKASSFNHEIVICDRTEDNFNKLNHFKHGLTYKSSAFEAVENAEIVILMVRPNQVLEALKDVSQNCLPDALIVSCAAGISSSKLEMASQIELPIVRAMPNIAIQSGKGSTALWYTKRCSFPRDEERIKSTFGVIGDLIQFENEDLLHLATVLLGSAPAFYLYFAECLIDAAGTQGLPKEEAKQLAKASLRAASVLLSEPDTDLESLIMRIAGKGGVTEAGLSGLKEDDGLKEITRNCVNRALNRSFNRDI